VERSIETDWRERLMSRVLTLAQGDGAERRHPQLMEWAVKSGISRELAEWAVELAREEDLEPALGLALVVSGVGVIELEPPTPITEENTRSLTPPEWVEPTEPAATIEAERRMRNTFRRLRGELAHGDLVRAFDRLLDDPDVGPVDYDVERS